MQRLLIPSGEARETPKNADSGHVGPADSVSGATLVCLSHGVTHICIQKIRQPGHLRKK
jgi:hypothetical protein